MNENPRAHIHAVLLRGWRDTVLQLFKMEKRLKR
jgi:hypothetical protein